MRIGFVGPKGSGKSTAAGMVSSYVGGAKTLSFADPLKVEIFDVLEELLKHMSFGHMLVGSDTVENKVAVVNLLKEPYLRRLIQVWGTEFRRSQDPNYWINKMDESMKGYEKIVVDDCRFENEAELLRARGFKLIRIQPAIIESTDTHASEMQWKNIETDAILVNRKENLGSLQRDLLAILSKFAFEG